jgi:glycosyltransferase involved in cell wall biosynthesis
MFFKKNKIVLIDFGSSDDLNTELRQLKIDKDPRRMTHVNFVGTS